MTLSEAIAQAVQNGAVKYGVSFYPKIENGILAYYFFNRQGLEVAYFTPDLEFYNPSTKGRKWDNSFLNNLRMVTI